VQNTVHTNSLLEHSYSLYSYYVCVHVLLDVLFKHYSKKSPELRRSELHSVVSPLLVKLTADHVSDWIRDKQLSQFLLAVVQHTDGDSVALILEKVVSLLDEPFDEEVCT